MVYLSIARTFLAPITEELSVLVKYGDPVQPLVCYINVFLAIQSDGCGPNELAVAFSEGPKLADIFLVEGDEAHPDPVRPGLAGPV